MTQNHLQPLPRVNPARAGMIRSAARSLVVVASKPRASGDDPVAGGVEVDPPVVKSLGVVFFRSGGDGGQGGAAAGAGVGAVVGLEHVGQVSQGGLGEVAAFAVLPLLVLLQQDGADQGACGLAVGEDLDHIGAALDLAVEPLDGVAAAGSWSSAPGGRPRRPSGPARRRSASGRSRGTGPSRRR